MRIVGIDEVGKGSIAGDLTVVGYARTGLIVPGVQDSKKLTEKQREALFAPILENGLFEEVSFSAAQIDHMGITLAHQNALQGVCKAFRAHFTTFKVLVDGKYRIWALRGLEQEAIVKGDQKIYEIACASIVAKVLRDRRISAHPKASTYGWGKSKGYGTKAHYEALREHGACEEHRQSFLGRFNNLVAGKQNL